MPGFYHPLSVWRRRMQTSDSTSMHNMIRRDHSAYALGLQGPDLFFLLSSLLPDASKKYWRSGTSQGYVASFANLLQSRKLFAGKKHSLSIADAYICGFMGHYTLDCTIHPYVYAFTGYNAQTPPSNTEYFGQHAYFETELDSELLYEKKHLYPPSFIRTQRFV